MSDALRNLLERERIYGFLIEGKRYQVSDELAFLKATVEMSLNRRDVATKFREYLKSVDL